MWVFVTTFRSQAIDEDPTNIKKKDHVVRWKKTKTCKDSFKKKCRGQVFSNEGMVSFTCC